jgi:hypothetical protein
LAYLEVNPVPQLRGICQVKGLQWELTTHYSVVVQATALHYTLGTTAHTMTIKTQANLTSHLQRERLDPVEAVWGTMLDIIYLMPTFIEAGGSITNAIGEVYPYPSPTMKVTYNNLWLLLQREIREGYPVIKVTGPDDITDRNSPWGIYYVHPDHLDKALCYLLEVVGTAVSNHGT